MKMPPLISAGRKGSLSDIRRLCAAVLRSTHRASHQRLYHGEVKAAAPSGTPLPPNFFASELSRRSKCMAYDPTHGRKDNVRLLEVRYSGHTPEPSTPQDSARVSDHEYQVRVGKACRVIVQTLPDFLSRGVVDLNDLAHSSSAAASTSSRPRFMRRLPVLSHSALRQAIWGKQPELNANQIAPFDSLYHPSIAFEFRPPIPTIGLGKGTELSEQPVPEGSNGSSTDLQRGGPTICFNGRTVYMTSAHVLRHALSALFYDITLHLDSARFEGRSRTASSWSDISSYLRRQSETPESEDRSSSSGPDRLVIRLRFEGVSRVTLQPHTYTVIFKYDFDRQSGTIGRHVVDNIQPIPGSKVWAGLTSAWGTLSPAGAGRGGAAHYEGLARPEEITSRP